jgi:hypothetical protein
MVILAKLVKTYPETKMFGSVVRETARKWFAKERPQY